MDIVEQLLESALNPNDLIQKYNSVKSDRLSWERRWSEIQDQVFPNYRDYSNTYNTGAPKTDRIKNTAGIISGMINSVVSVLSAQTADPAAKWLNLKFASNDLNENKVAKDWLTKCCDSLYNLFADPDSGFYPSTFSFHFDWYTLGTACREIIIRQDTGKIHFSCVPMNDIFIDLSGYGDIQTIYRRFMLTAKQAIELWGEKVHRTIQESVILNSGALSKKKYEFFEVVMPNPIKSKVPSLDYLSCIVDYQNKSVVSYNFHAFSPYVVSRFFVSPGEIYGRSYVWNSMPDMKIINALTKYIVQASDFSVFPPILVRDSDSIPPCPITPGVFIQGLDENGRPTYQPMQVVGNIGIAMQLLEQKKSDLERTLVADAILFPTVGRYTNMTAEETRVRDRQSANRARPIAVMLEEEDLNKTVKRSLKLLEQMQELPPFPYEQLQIDPNMLPDPIMNLRVSFSGSLARLQKTEDIQNMDILLQKVSQILPISPETADLINIDQIIAEEAKIYGLPPEVINPTEVVQQIREERAKQQQQLQEQQMQNQSIDNLMKFAKLKNKDV